MAVNPLKGVAVGLIVALSATPALASSIFHYGGNTYERVEAGGEISWADARAAAEALGGHLAVFETAAENDAIAASTELHVFTGPGFGTSLMWGPWFGLYAPGSDTDPSIGALDSDYVWINGAARTFSRWNPIPDGGEPSGDNDTPTTINGVHFFTFLSAQGWNDDDNNSPRPNSYLVEYEAPEPTSIALIGVGAAAAAIRRRRK